MLIVLNHKMNLNIKEILAYEEAIKNLNVVVMPQTPYMGIFTQGKYTLGSQCISEYNASGGVSAEALVGIGVKYVLVGHAERRIIRKENDEIIAKKIMDIINHQMIPIMCVGETLEERKNGQSLQIIENQISNVFDRLEGSLRGMVIAYEPVWSIGSNQTPSPEAISGMLEYIKIICQDKYNFKPKLLYGGSISQKNIAKFKSINNLEGFLIGTASLNIEEVKNIYQICRED